MTVRSSADGHPRHAEDAGETLLEILVTITILGIAMVAILTSIATAIRLSTSQRRSASADVVLGLGAEAIKGASPAACGALTTSSYRAPLDAIAPTIALPVGWTTANLSITSAACDNASTLKLQTIRLKATAPCPSACQSETVDVLKRSP